MRLSVLVPVYNSEKLVSRALDSVLKQKDAGDFEVVAVNDGSKDNSLSVLEEYRAKYPDTVRVINSENRGVGAARNLALKNAAGEYITYLDSDDFVADDYISSIMAELAFNPDIFVFDAISVTEDGKEDYFEAQLPNEGRVQSSDFILSLPCPWNKVIKKELLERTGFAFPEGIWYEDLAAVPSVGIEASFIVYKKKPLYRYYQSSGSITRSGGYPEKRADVLKSVAIISESLKADFPVEAEYIAYHNLYRGAVWDMYDHSRFDLIDKANAFMRENFSDWKSNPIIGASGFAEKLYSSLFYGGHYSVIRFIKRIF